MITHVPAPRKWSKLLFVAVAAAVVLMVALSGARALGLQGEAGEKLDPSAIGLSPSKMQADEGWKKFTEIWEAIPGMAPCDMQADETYAKICPYLPDFCF